MAKRPRLTTDIIARKRQRAQNNQAANFAVRLLGVSRKNSVLFAAVAAALGRSWVPGTAKTIGYALVREYASQHGMPCEEIVVLVTRPPAPATTDDFLQSYQWRRLRMGVIKKRGARCECCGATPKDGTTVINVDHIKPRKLFPELALEESNLQVLCHNCNHGKGNWDQTDWREAEPKGPVH